MIVRTRRGRVGRISPPFKRRFRPADQLSPSRPALARTGAPSEREPRTGPPGPPRCRRDTLRHRDHDLHDSEGVPRPQRSDPGERGPKLEGARARSGGLPLRGRRGGGGRCGCGRSRVHRRRRAQRVRNPAPELRVREGAPGVPERSPVLRQRGHPPARRLPRRRPQGGRTALSVGRPALGPRPRRRAGLRLGELAADARGSRRRERHLARRPRQRLLRVPERPGALRAASVRRRSTRVGLLVHLPRAAARHSRHRRQRRDPPDPPEPRLRAHSSG